MMKHVIQNGLVIALASTALLSATVPLQAQNTNLAENQSIKDNAPQNNATLVITAVVPDALPYSVETDPKAPRQPIPASDGADYLKTIPGFVTIRNGGTNGDPVLRGMFGSRLNIVTNGGVILGACGGRMDNPTSYISPESYDRLTVIKGPQTVRWGPTGSAGTVLFERDPQHFDKFTIKADGSTVFASNQRVESRIDATMGDKLGYIRVIGNRASSHDYKDGDGHRVPSKWDKWNGDLTLGWTPDANTSLELSAGKGDGEARYAGRGMDGSQFKRESLGAKFVKTDIGTVLDRIEAQLYYNYADHVMDNFRLRTKAANKMAMESEPDRRTWGGRIATTWRWEDVSLVTGFDAQTNTHRSKNRKNGRVTSGWNKDATFDTYGLFSEVTWSFMENRRLIGGARLDWASVEDFRTSSSTLGDKRHETLPSVFLRYEHDLDALPLSTYIGIGYTERFPDFWELFSPKLAPAHHVNAFAGIEPEKTTQLDFGARYDKADTSLWFSGYVGSIHDYILFDYRQTNSRATNINAFIAGGEAGISQKFRQYWRADASIAYAYGENRTDDEALPQMPPFEARLGLTYERDNWSLGGLWRLVAKQNRIAVDKGNVVGKDYAASSAFGVFSLNGHYQFNQNLRLTAGVDNLFNKDYSEHLNRDGDAGFGFASHYQLHEPGRTFWGKLDYKF